MKSKFIFFFLLSWGITISGVFSQNEKKIDQSYDLSLDFQSRYVWRGLLLGGSSPSLQPGMSYTIEGFSIGAWGAFSCNQLTAQELDLSLSYTFLKDMFTVMVTDYCFPNEANADFNYFNYDKNKTSHLFEAGLSFNGLEKVPVSASVYVNFYGADAKTKNGNNMYSSYAEIAYSPSIEKLGVDLSVFVGAALNGQKYTTVIDGMDIPVYGFYGNKNFSVINMGLTGTKTISINDNLSMPCTAGLLFNPNAKKAYFTFSVGLAL